MLFDGVYERFFWIADDRPSSTCRPRDISSCIRTRNARRFSFLEVEPIAPSSALGTYWKIEKLVRKLESAPGSVIGATEALYPVRRSLYESFACRILWIAGFFR